MDEHLTDPAQPSRRHVLQILAALGITGPAAQALAAQAVPRVPPAALEGAASLLGGRFDEARLRVAEAAVRRNLDQLQAVRELPLPDDLEPAVVFQPRRS